MNSPDQNESIFLSKEDIKRITESVRRKTQAGRLLEMNITFSINWAGWPLVLKQTYFKLHGIKIPTPKERTKPDFSAFE